METTNITNQELKPTYEELTQAIEQQKKDFNTKISALEVLIEELEKPVVSDSFMKKLELTIEDSIDSYRFEEQDFEYELELNWDNKISVCSIDFLNTAGITDKIMQDITTLFKYSE